MKPKPPNPRGGEAAFATVDGVAVDDTGDTPASADPREARFRKIEVVFEKLKQDFLALKREAQARSGQAAIGGETGVRPSGTVNNIYGGVGTVAEVCYVYHEASGGKSVTTKGGRAK